MPYKFAINTGTGFFKTVFDKQANEIFRVFEKPDFFEKSGFYKNFMPENLC